METKNKILAKAYDLIMKYGVRSVSMDDIAKSCSISKKTVYQHVDNKDDLINQLMDLKIEEDKIVFDNNGKTSKNAVEEFILMAKVAIDLLRKMSPTLIYDLQKYHPKLWEMCEQKQQELVADMVKKNVARGIQEGNYRKELRVDSISKIFLLLSFSVTNENLFPLEEFDRSELYKDIASYHIHSIVTPQGKTIFEQLNLE